MVIASVSTLIFNGNPLLRYDAYYILADLIEIPNLGARSLRYWSYLLERYLLGVKERDPPHASPARKPGSCSTAPPPRFIAFWSLS